MSTSHRPTTGPVPTGALPLVLDVGTRAARTALALGALSAVIGVIAAVTAVTAAARSGIVGLVLTWAIALMCLGLTTVLVVHRRSVARPRRLIIEAAGLRWDDPWGIPWGVRWEELSGVRAVRVRALRIRSLTTQATYLDLFPGDPLFRQRHPEMEHLWQFRQLSNGYRLSLGPPRNLDVGIDDWLRRFRPTLHAGVHVEDDRRLRTLARWGDPTGSAGWLATPETRRRAQVPRGG